MSRSGERERLTDTSTLAASLVDLDRYPLLALDGPEASAVVEAVLAGNDSSPGLKLHRYGRLP